MDSNYIPFQTQDAQIKFPSETYADSELLAHLQKRSCSVEIVVHYFEA